MFPFRGMGVFCCAHVVEGIEAIATPEATVLSTSRRERFVIAGRVYRRTQVKKTFSFSSRLSRHRRNSMRRMLCLFLMVCSPVLAEDAMFRGNPQHTGVYAGAGI